MTIDSDLRPHADIVSDTRTAWPAHGAEENTVRGFLRNSALFVLGAMVIYLLVYAAADSSARGCERDNAI